MYNILNHQIKALKLQALFPRQKFQNYKVTKIVNLFVGLRQIPSKILSHFKESFFS